MGNGKARLRKTIMNKAAYATTASRTIPDPCLSSDLARATMALLADEGPVAKAMISFGRQWRRPTKEQLAYAAHVAAGLERGNTSPGAITLVEGDTGQTGRGSWRERVCQYV